MIWQSCWPLASWALVFVMVQRLPFMLLANFFTRTQAMLW